MTPRTHSYHQPCALLWGDRKNPTAVEKSCVLFGDVLRDPEVIQRLTERGPAPPFPLGRALIPSKSQVSCSLLFSSQKKDNPQLQFSSPAQGSSGKQKMGGTELLWAPKWKQNPDTFAWEHFCCLWSSRNASPWTCVVSPRVCDEMCGTGRGSSAKLSGGLVKASSPPSCYHRESQRQVLGSSSGLSLLQGRPWNGAGGAELWRNAELWQHHVLAPRVTQPGRRRHPQQNLPSISQGWERVK